MINQIITILRLKTFIFYLKLLFSILTCIYDILITELKMVLLNSALFLMEACEGRSKWQQALLIKTPWCIYALVCVAFLYSYAFKHSMLQIELLLFINIITSFLHKVENCIIEIDIKPLCVCVQTMSNSRFVYINWVRILLRWSFVLKNQQSILKI